MTAFVLSIEDLFDLAEVETATNASDDARVKEVARRAFAFIGRPLEITVENGFVTVSFLEKSDEVTEAQRLAEKAAKRAREGNYGKAISIWKRVLELNPSFSTARRDLAMVYFEQGDLDEAKDLLIENLRQNPKDGWSWVVLGNIYAKGADDLDAAEKHIKRALALTPDDPWALNSLAAVQMEKGNTEEAIRIFRQAITAHPAMANPYYGLAATLHRLGRDEAASQALFQLFQCSERQDARSEPVFHNARELLVSVETRLAQSFHSDAFKGVEDYRARVATLSGYPVRVSTEELRDRVGATIQIAWKHGRDFHLIKCRAGYPNFLLDHLKAHELKHLEMECEARKVGRNRFFTTTAETRKSAILSMQSDIRRLQKEGYSEDSIQGVILSLVSGLSSFLFNCPLDMLIEASLRREMPSLAHAQFASTRVIAREAAETVSNPQIRKLTPRNVLRASLALNGAYALFLDDLFQGATDYAAVYRQAENFALSQKLFAHWKARAPHLKAGGEYDLVDEFADIVGFRSWYEWRNDPGEHIPTAEPLREGTTNPGLLREKHPAAIFFFLDVLKRFDGMALERIRDVAFEAAMTGRTGLDYASSEKKYELRVFPGERFSGLQMMCFMHAAFRRIAPGEDTGMDLEEPFLSALAMHQSERE